MTYLAFTNACCSSSVESQTKRAKSEDLVLIVAVAPNIFPLD